MKSIFLLFFFFITNLCFTQNHIIVDSESKIPISYANIKIIKTNKGTYSDEYGKFSINQKFNDSIQISCLGYESFFEKIGLLKDTVFINPQTQNLNEVIIYSTSPSIKKIGFKKHTLTWFPYLDVQFGVLIKPIDKYSNSIIKSILIPTIKNYYFSNKDSINTNYESIIKVSLFSNKNNVPAKPLIDSPIIVNCSNKSNNIISINLLKKNIKFSKEGIFVLIERVGEINSKGEVLKQQMMRPGLVFTNKLTNDFLFSKSVYKYKSSNGWKEVDYKNMNLKKQIYLAIKLELAKYED